MSRSAALRRFPITRDREALPPLSGASGFTLRPAEHCSAFGDSTFSRSALAPLLALLLALPVSAAWAGCADGARPAVDWQRCNQQEVNLAGADLKESILRETRLMRADLTGANLAGTDARRARFVNAKLAKANLERAKAAEADFTRADLTGANLKQADLRRAKLVGAVLIGADLTGAKLDDADLLHAQLGGATWTDGKTVCPKGAEGGCR